MSFLLGLLLRRPHPAGEAPAPETILRMIRSQAITALLILAATGIMAWVERRPLGTFGFGGGRKVRHLAQGIFWGAASLAVLVGALWATGHLVFDGRLLGAGAAIRNAGLFAVAFLGVAFTEEYLLRGYLQYTLARGCSGILAFFGAGERSAPGGFWAAALVLSFLFGFGHAANPGESPLGLLAAGLIGLVFCFSLRLSGSLWWAFGFHFSWNWCQSFLYGVANSGTLIPGHLTASHPQGAALISGGTTGPEGSILILPLVAVLALIIHRTLKPGKVNEGGSGSPAEAPQA
jgi:membrane protease YdiL (CAAX protease family)